MDTYCVMASQGTLNTYPFHFHRSILMEVLYINLKNNVRVAELRLIEITCFTLDTKI